MSLSVSIVIPCKNDEIRLKKTLESCQNLNVLADQIILVDDGSTSPIHIEKDYANVQLLRIFPGIGPAGARNAGAEKATGDIILFLDADVTAESELIMQIREHFQNNPSLDAVQGVYTEKTRIESLFSKYQNYYYHYAFISIPSEYVAVCATFCFAIKNSVFKKMNGFDSRIKQPTVEDEAFGYKLAKAGYSIIIDPKIRVHHWAEYSMRRFIARKFRMSFNQGKSILRGHKPPIWGKNQFFLSNPTHHSRKTLLSLFVAPVIPISYIINIPFLITFVLLYCCLNLKFWQYLIIQEPPQRLIAFLFLNWLDHVVIFIGIISGTVHYFTCNHY
ncbi:glycosyltransferase family 2 protein [bacterium]|nr:glycosyltransferase family 2 protein [candidate division CSSED10-310 bacterium]